MGNLTCENRFYNQQLHAKSHRSSHEPPEGGVSVQTGQVGRGGGHSLELPYGNERSGETGKKIIENLMKNKIAKIVQVTRYIKKD